MRRAMPVDIAAATSPAVNIADSLSSPVLYRLEKKKTGVRYLHPTSATRDSTTTTATVAARLAAA